MNKNMVFQLLFILFVITIFPYLSSIQIVYGVLMINNNPVINCNTGLWIFTSLSNNHDSCKGSIVEYNKISAKENEDDNDNNNVEENDLLDKFEIRKIYPTKEDGREWFIDMDDPNSDKEFYTDATLEKQSDGSWRVSGEERELDQRGQIRLEVHTPKGKEPWKNVEMTGYAKIVKTTGHDKYKNSDLENIIQWYARGGRHSGDVPCEGTSLKGRIHLDGNIAFVKEIWHSGGYTDESAKAQATSPLVTKQDAKGNYFDGKWFGFKVIMFNVDNDKSVQMEIYVDENANNIWKKATSLIDKGDWYSDNEQFDDVNCGKPRNYIITNSGPIAAFRSDYIIWDMKNLSIREITVR
jgi:hypothetical protein